MNNLANGEIEFSFGDGIARLKINRPTKANSISMPMLEAIVDICQQLDTNDNLKALVICAEGAVFSGGVDLKVFDPERTATEVCDRYLQLWDQMIEGFENLPVPVIGVIQGPAVAGGLSIALACDLRIASTNATFGYPRVPQGHAPGRHNLTNLVRTIGPGRTRLVFLGARIVSATEAADWGLVDLVVDADALETEVTVLLEKIQATPGALVTMTNRLIDDPENDALWTEILSS